MRGARFPKGSVGSRRREELRGKCVNGCRGRSVLLRGLAVAALFLWLQRFDFALSRVQKYAMGCMGWCRCLLLWRGDQHAGRAGGCVCVRERGFALSATSRCPLFLARTRPCVTTAAEPAGSWQKTRAKTQRGGGCLVAPPLNFLRGRLCTELSHNRYIQQWLLLARIFECVWVQPQPMYVCNLADVVMYIYTSMYICARPHQPGHPCVVNFDSVSEAHGRNNPRNNNSRHDRRLYVCKCLLRQNTCCTSLYIMMHANQSTQVIIN